MTATIAILEVSLYGLVGGVVDWLDDHTPETAFSFTEDNVLIWAGCTLVALPALSILQTLFINQTILTNFPMSIRWSLHRQLLTHSLNYYNNELSGRLATKLMQTAFAMQEATRKMICGVLYVCIYLVSSLGLVAALNLYLVVPFLIWLLAYFFILYRALPTLALAAKERADANSCLVGRLVDTYSNIETVKLFSSAELERNYARNAMSLLLTSSYKNSRLATGVTSRVWILSTFLILSVGFLCILLWSKGAITTGAIAAAGALVLKMNGISHWIMWETSSLFENFGMIKDGITTFTKRKDVQDKSSAQPLNLSYGSIEFSNISFGYDNSNTVIRNLNLEINAGERLGIVGPSGAGKSTLIKLLLRLYDIQGGRILIDSQDISTVSQDSLRKNIAVVSQDVSLMNRSIWENLRYGSPNSSDSDIIKAAKRAFAHDFILSLEDSQGRRGYEAHVGERGVTLSGGQRQRLSIARAFLKNSPILILDEATSALDSEAENSIQQNLDELMTGRTVIVIAHRLSTLSKLDRLVVIENGTIVEQGPHSSLIEMGGVYSRFWLHQSKGHTTTLEKA
ncbi:ABC transporter ATP-binding protein [Microbulbifer sp. VAAF005]|uniref:ABC transporter ATP-binding protein n=1 Tax=Microbulbifer sp. VAAF005 TaxID=3034230 RepID=UPI0024AD7093|nr:ABC transporter ATP-binding protein [Microbulbifer sp. VAAF005]WHI44690.1 ABC transporter ATP-binding protein [Microbulbifer sp. VAAF005]